MARIPMTVKIVAKQNATDAKKIDFKMTEPNGDDIDVLTFDKSEHGKPGNPMKKSDVHEVHFLLTQEQGLNLEFAHGKDDVLWVAMGDENSFPACPTTKPSSPSTIFYAEKSTPNTMIAVNTNPTKQQFAFTINFVDKTQQGPKTLIPYDPPGSNNNNGVDGRDDAFVSSNVVIGAVAAVALLAVAFLVLR